MNGMKSYLLSRAFLAICLPLLVSVALATSNYEYKADEFVTIANGLSPNGQYAIAAHGQGDLGYDNFHIYLMRGNGKRIGPLEEIKQTLDTGANAFCAKWSANSQQVTVIYRVSRQEPLKAVSYRIGDGRAFILQGPSNVNAEEQQFWGKSCN